MPWRMLCIISQLLTDVFSIAIRVMCDFCCCMQNVLLNFAAAAAHVRVSRFHFLAQQYVHTLFMRPIVICWFGIVGLVAIIVEDYLQPSNNMGRSTGPHLGYLVGTWRLLIYDCPFAFGVVS